MSIKLRHVQRAQILNSLRSLYAQSHRSINLAARLSCLLIVTIFIAGEGVSFCYAQNPTPSLRKPELNNRCPLQYQAFVGALDALLASNPPSVTTVHDLINRSFPIEGCNVQAVLEISRKSRFFSYVSETRHYHLMVFDSKKLSSPIDPGYHVQIGFSKDTGNSLLPSANINP